MRKIKYIPQNVLLDAGGPLLFTFGFHLLFGNILIGWAEYSFVKKVFKIPLNNAGLLVIIAANYVSLVAGMLLSVPLNFPAGNDTFQNLFPALTVTLIVSIILEWPFYFFAIKKVSPETSLRKTIGITTVAQVFSYLIMLVYYFITKV